jgi:hypothetical protein
VTDGIAGSLATTYGSKAHSATLRPDDPSRNDPQKQLQSGGPITPDNTGAEIYCTVYAFAESPAKQGELWAGSDDG